MVAEIKKMSEEEEEERSGGRGHGSFTQKPSATPPFSFPLISPSLT